MSRKERKRSPWTWAVVIFVVLAATGVWYVLTQTAFAMTHKIIPPLPTTGDCTELTAAINQYDWDTELALAIAKAESSCETTAKGDTDITFYDCPLEYENDVAACAANQQLYGYSVGAFQIRILPGREHCDTYDVATNVACAYEVYTAAGNSFEPWSGYTTGKYQQYYWRTLAEVWPF